MTLLQARFHDEDAARKHVEKMRWPDGPVCPKCGVINEATELKARADSKKPGRKGLWKCRACRSQFTVLVDSIFSDSHIPLHKWLYAIHLICASKKGMSAHQLWRMLEFGSYRTAWFMLHRIRWSMGQEPLAGMLQGIVEIDETYVGGKEKRGPQQWKMDNDPDAPLRVPFKSKKTPVVAMLERGGNVRSFPVERVTSENIKPLVKQFVADGTRIMTDSATALKFPKNEYQHDTVNHFAKEYARKGPDGTTITTNSVEGFFAILKRGNYGVYHHWSKHYMAQYLREFDFRFNARHIDDNARAALALKATEGKRLMLRAPKAIA